MILQADAGTERFVSWATRKAAQLDATRRDLKLTHLAKHFVVDGVSIWLKVDERGALVRLTGSSPFGYGPYITLDSTFSALASVSRSGKPSGPRRYRMYVHPTGPVIAYSGSGILGTESGFPSAEGLAAAESHTPAVSPDYVAPTALNAGVRGTIGEVRLAYLTAAGGGNTVNQGLTSTIRDASQPEESRWSDTTAALFPAEVVGASTGGSLFTESFFASTLDYAMTSPLPGGGTLNFGTAAQLDSTNLFTPTNRAVLSYITSITPGTVYTDHDGAGIEIAWACWLDVEGVDEFWTYTRDPETLVVDVLRNVSRSWTQRMLLVQNTGGTFVASPNPGLRIFQHTASNVTFLDDCEAAYYNPATLGSYPGSFKTVAGVDDAGNVIEVESKTTWGALTFSATGGPRYRLADGVSEANMEGYGLSATPAYGSVELMQNGSVVFSDRGPDGNSNDVSADLFAGGNPRTSTIGNAGISDVSKFGVSYALRGSLGDDVIRGMFWDGTAATTVDAPSPAAQTSDFRWSMSGNQVAYMYGWKGDTLSYYVDDALALSIPLRPTEALYMADWRNPNVFYTTRDPSGLPEDTTTAVYTAAKDANTGLWSYTVEDLSLQETWSFADQELARATLGLITPYTALSPDDLANTVIQ